MRYEFGQFGYMDGEGLTFGGKFIRLAPKVQALLEALLKAGGKTITKDELLQDVWTAADASEDSLFKAVSALRRAIAKHSNDDIVQSVHGRGYRLGVAVRMAETSAAAQTSKEKNAARASDLCRKAIDFQGTHSSLGFKVVRELLEEAISLDPDSEEAWNIWCQHEMYGARAWQTSPSECNERARRGALELLRINPGSGFGLVTLGYVRAIVDRQLTDGLALIDAALKLGTSHEASFHKGWVLIAHDDVDGAVQAFQDEFNGQSHPRNVLSSLCLALYFAGQPRRAVELAQSQLSKFVPYGSTWVIRALAEAACGDLDAAYASAMRVSTNDENPTWQRTSLASVLLARGDRERAESLLEELQRDPVPPIPAFTVPIYYNLGRVAEAKAVLAKSVAEKCVLVPMILRDPRMKGWPGA